MRSNQRAQQDQRMKVARLDIGENRIAAIAVWIPKREPAVTQFIY
jgi:hypothetical protein